LYEHFLRVGFRLSFPPIVRKLLCYLGISPAQIKPNGWRYLLGCCILWPYIFGDGVLSRFESFSMFISPLGMAIGCGPFSLGIIKLSICLLRIQITRSGSIACSWFRADGMPRNRMMVTSRSFTVRFLVLGNLLLITVSHLDPLSLQYSCSSGSYFFLITSVLFSGQDIPALNAEQRRRVDRILEFAADKSDLAQDIRDFDLLVTRGRIHKHLGYRVVGSWAPKKKAVPERKPIPEEFPREMFPEGKKIPGKVGHPERKRVPEKELPSPEKRKLPEKKAT
jgi:hypothetical protein